jgi:hypothetical protein
MLATRKIVIATVVSLGRHGVLLFVAQQYKPTYGEPKLDPGLQLSLQLQVNEPSVIPEPEPEPEPISPSIPELIPEPAQKTAPEKVQSARPIELAKLTVHRLRRLRRSFSGTEG